MLSCPSCESKNAVKNGFIYNENRNRKSKAGDRQFLKAPQQDPISQATQDLID